jgi:hypothetical protein
VHIPKKSKIKCTYGAISPEYRNPLNKIIFFLEDPRDYDELAEDEETHAEGTSTQGVIMEDAHAILNEEDTDTGSSFPPYTPPSSGKLFRYTSQAAFNRLGPQRNAA